MIKVPRACEVYFSGIRLQTKGGLESGLRQRKSFRGMINPEEIEFVVRIGEQAVGLEERRIARHRLIQQVNRLQQILSGAESCRIKHCLGATIEIERCDIRRGRVLDCRFFTWGKSRLKLIG